MINDNHLDFLAPPSACLTRVKDSGGFVGSSGLYILGGNRGRTTLGISAYQVSPCPVDLGLEKVFQILSPLGFFLLVLVVGELFLCHGDGISWVNLEETRGIVSDKRRGGAYSLSVQIRTK